MAIIIRPQSAWRTRERGLSATLPRLPKTLVAAAKKAWAAIPLGLWANGSSPIPLIAFLVFVLSRSYRGIVQDAYIYLGRALADLDPNGVGRDLMFVNDGQFGFSLFRFAADATLWCCGLAMAAKALAIMAALAWFFAASAFARQFASGAAVWVVVIFAALLPAAYGAPYLFGFAELIAIPRPFAEAFVLAGLAALAARRDVFCLGCLVAAALLHPIMALAGFGVFLSVLGLEDKRWFLFCAGAGAVLIFGGALGLPLVDRLFTEIDPSLKSLHEFAQPVFVSKPLASRKFFAAHRSGSDHRHCRAFSARARSADPCGDHSCWFGRHSNFRDFWRLAFVASRRASSALAHGMADGVGGGDGPGRVRC